MNRQYLNKIRGDIYDICFQVEREIVKHDHVSAEAWAYANSTRHAYVIKEIENYIKSYNGCELKILNASGLSCGHQDFAISSYLKSKNISFSWNVVESPLSPYLSSPVFNKMISESGAQLLLTDFAQGDGLNLHEEYNIILFTEIIEHLEHATLLRTLNSLNSLLSQDGILIITTPNMAYVGNRLRLLFGNGDINYWGDGQDNLCRGLWGHIVYYDITRLQRILSDLAYKIVDYYTYNYTMNMCGNKIKSVLTHLLTKIIKNSAQSIFIVATKGERKNIESRC